MNLVGNVGKLLLPHVRKEDHRHNILPKGEVTCGDAAYGLAKGHTSLGRFLWSTHSHSQLVIYWCLVRTLWHHFLKSLPRQNDWFVRGIDPITVSVHRKGQVRCAVYVQIQNCLQKKPYISLGCEMPSALVCLMTDCVTLMFRSIFLNEMWAR